MENHKFYDKKRKTWSEVTEENGMIIITEENGNITKFENEKAYKQAMDHYNKFVGEIIYQ
jgi:hypothetical protein